MSDKTPMRTDGMNEPDVNGQGDGRAGDERLLALLGELIEDEGRQETADLLGVSLRTLFRTVRTGELSARMRDALELQLRSDGKMVAAPQREHDEGLERRVGQLEREVEELRAARDAVPSQPRAASPPGVQGVSPDVIGQPRVQRPWRPYPQLVTLEPEAGEELVYGEALAAIAGWRTARAGHLDTRRSRVERATARVRMCELEITLIGDHELTLPPAVYPWDRFDRRDEVWRREQSLADARAERRRALRWRWVRRILTLGLWRR